MTRTDKPPASAGAPLSATAPRADAAQRPAPGSAASSGSLLACILLATDLLGLWLMFNASHLLYLGQLPPDDGPWSFGAKLVGIGGTTFLSYYLLDLYNLRSTLSQLGTVERSFIAMFMVGVATPVLVWLVGPTYIGGAVGRGVLTIGLGLFWLWSIGCRHMLERWLRSYSEQVSWLVLLQGGGTGTFLRHFRAVRPYEGLLILVDGDSPADQDVATPDWPDDNTRLVGSWADLEQVLATTAVSGVVVAGRSRLPASMVDKLMAVRLRGTRVYELNDFYEHYLQRVPVFNLDEEWLAMTGGFDLLHNEAGLRFKRYMDIAVALALGVLLAPLLAVTALLVLITAGRPVFYHQQRTGENNRTFTVHKFRTMVRDAEQAGGARFASRADPRVTRSGAFMRKYRLDELPQLWNVLKGDMSFIGPRPERPELIKSLEQQIPYYNLRHLVKPGITGWAQVMYGYGDSIEDTIEKLQFDLYYLKNHSLLLDLAIMVRSVKVILFGTGR